MTYPPIDSKDFVFNLDRSRPVETPHKVWVVYYQAIDGHWVWSYPTFYYENALKEVAALSRPMVILEYNLASTITIDESIRQAANQLTTKITKIMKKSRKVRQVRD